MRSFFSGLSKRDRQDPEVVAKKYGRHLFSKRTQGLVDQKKIATAKFHVGIGIDPGDFDELTKRTVLVADTLLLSHNRAGTARSVRKLKSESRRSSKPTMSSAGIGLPAWSQSKTYLEMICPDLADLGRWLLAAEPLLRTGSAWYLPSYSIYKDSVYQPERGGLADFVLEETNQPRHATQYDSRTDVPSLLNFAREGRRLVAQDDSTTTQIQSQVVRPVVEDLELPFLTGLSLNEFSKVTVGEFDAYRAHRSWLQQRLLGIDTALNAVQSQTELIKIGLEIQDGIRSVQAQMDEVRRKRLTGYGGVVIGTVSASLVAVYGPTMQSVLSAVVGGAAGGLWAAIQTSTENSPRAVGESSWYYVWSLSQAPHTARG